MAVRGVMLVTVATLHMAMIQQWLIPSFTAVAGPIAVSMPPNARPNSVQYGAVQSAQQFHHQPRGSGSPIARRCCCPLIPRQL